MNNPLKYSDPSGMKMMQGDFDNNMFDISGKWVADFEMSHPLYGGASGGGSIPSYSYNYGDGEYYNNYGERVSWAQVNQNYVSHEISDIQVTWLYYGGTTDKPYSSLTGISFSDGTRFNFFSDEVKQAAYKDVTTAFNAQLEKTMAYFTIARGLFDLNYPNGGLEKEIGKLLFFRSKVNDKAVFDIKLTSFSRKSLGGQYGLYRGQVFRYDDFGNYNFGLGARYFGLTLNQALLGAGINQISKGNPDLTNPGGYFDDREDTEMIINGYNHKW